MQNDQSSPHCALVLLWLLGFSYYHPHFKNRSPRSVLLGDALICLLFFFLFVYMKGRAIQMSLFFSFESKKALCFCTPFWFNVGDVPVIKHSL